MNFLRFLRPREGEHADSPRPSLLWLGVLCVALLVALWWFGVRP